MPFRVKGESSPIPARLASGSAPWQDRGKPAIQIMRRSPPSLSLTRRSLLAGLALGAAASPLRAAEGAWPAWCAAFLQPDGRVVDPGQGGISHSEGQAYGLVLAQAMGDREAFERIEGWTRGTLASRQDALMAWAWRDGSVADWRNATDGDLLRACALLRAERDSGWTGHRTVASNIAQALQNICLAPDPWASGAELLKPADQAPASAEGVLVNPSYYLGRALRELAAAFDAPRLAAVADRGEALLRNPLALRDWVLVTPQGLLPPEGHDDHFGWDALRIPLYLVWSGRLAHPALPRAARRFAQAEAPGHVAVVTDASGALLVQSDAPGFRAVAALAEARAPTHAQVDYATARGEYYPATLDLLARLAWREGHGPG